MSRIYFHSEYGDAEVRGSERAYGAGLCDRMLAMSLGLEYEDDDSPSNPSDFRRIMRPNAYALEYWGKQFVDKLKTQLAVSMSGPVFICDGKDVDSFQLALNSAIAAGSDPVKLMARLHGQCEIHCYVEGPNRKWIASIVAAGIASSIMRADSGWESVVTLLESRDDCPVVTSYSVCEQFPYMKDGTEKQQEKYYDKPARQQWKIGMKWLREESYGLELAPDKWEGFYFGHGLNGFKIREYVNNLRKKVD